MINRHDTKCLCGNGTVHFHFDTKGNPHSKLDCAKCASKYHVTPFGLLPRHVPLRYPKDKNVRESERLRNWIGSSIPRYGHAELARLMNNEELVAAYGPTKEVDILKWCDVSFRPDIRAIVHKLYIMNLLASVYTKHTLLIMHDNLVDDIYNAEAERLMRQYCLSEGEFVALLSRTIMDYEIHEELQDWWEAEKSKMKQELYACYEKQEKQRQRIDRQQKDLLIPWSQLPKINK